MSEMSLEARTNAAEIVRLCVEAKLPPELAAQMLERGLSFEDAKLRIHECGEIKRLAGIASSITDLLDPAMADALILNGAGLEFARDKIYGRILETQSGEIINVLPPPGIGPAAKRDHGWGKAVAKMSKVKPE